MSMQYQLGASPLNSPATREFEEKRITKQDKYLLDKTIEKESKQGWLVKARSRDSEGNHGVVLFRKTLQAVCR